MERDNEQQSDMNPYKLIISFSYLLHVEICCIKNKIDKSVSDSIYLVKKFC